MWDLLELVLDELHIDNKATKITRNNVKNIRGNSQKAKVLLEKIEAELSINSCIKCDNRFFCSFFLACTHYELNNVRQAQVYIKQAIRDFSLSNSQWNATLANWIYGEIHILLNLEMPAYRELTKTIKMLEAIREEFRWENKYEKRNQCTKFISKIKNRLKNLNANWEGEFVRKTKNQPFFQHHKPKNTETYIYPWKQSQLIFPVQSQVRAGPEGSFIFESESEPEAILDELSFNEIPHCFYNLREEGNPIILHNPRVYRWFRVEGNSMNEANPVPIMDNDYVLAIDLNPSNMKAQVENIVIAVLKSPSSNERAGVVKEYTQNGLESRSSEDYPTISLEDANIRGLAIAVAKPTHITKEGGGSIAEELYNAIELDKNEETKNLFENLLTKVLHDTATAIRLTRYEKDHFPNVSINILLKNAIDRWEHDNR